MSLVRWDDVIIDIHPPYNHIMLAFLSCGAMRCPRCGSENISSIIDTKTHTKGFDGGDACCGYLLFGWPGVLCGLCNTGDTTTTTKTTNICNDCGNRF